LRRVKLRPNWSTTISKLQSLSKARWVWGRVWRILLTGWRVFSKLGVAKPILNQAENFPR
jgi:hypothetical protein